MNQIISKQEILYQLNEFDYWSTENFRVNLVIINMDCLNLQGNHMKISLNCEDIFSNEIEIEAREYNGNSSVKYARFSSNNRPMVALTIKLPDNRLKNQIINHISRIVNEMVLITYRYY